MSKFFKNYIDLSLKHGENGFYFFPSTEEIPLDAMASVPWIRAIVSACLFGDCFFLCAPLAYAQSPAVSGFAVPPHDIGIETQSPRQGPRSRMHYRGCRRATHSRLFCGGNREKTSNGI